MPAMETTENALKATLKLLAGCYTHVSETVKNIAKAK